MEVINATDIVVFLDHQELSPMHPNGWRRTLSGVHTNQNISKVSPSLLEVRLDNPGAGLSDSWVINSGVKIADVEAPPM